MGNNRRGGRRFVLLHASDLEGLLFDQVSSPGFPAMPNIFAAIARGRLDAGVQSNARLCYPCSVFGS